MFAARSISAAGSGTVIRLLKKQLKAKANAFDARRAFVIALLAAFILQGQLVASHFHVLAASAPALAADGDTTAVNKDQKKAPVGDDCPVCQQLASAHNLFLHAASALSLPELIGAQSFAVFDERAPVALIALNWQSRAPPL
jgi:hypothetical protein